MPADPPVRDDQIEVLYDITPDNLRHDPVGGSGDADREAGSPDPKMIALVVVVLIVVMVVIVNLARVGSPTESSPTSAPPTTADRRPIERPSTIAPVEVFPPVPVIDGPLGWEIAPSTNPLAQYGVSVRSLAGAAPGFVAIAGVDVTPFNRPVWASTDGLNWTQVDPETFEGYSATEVVATDYTFFLEVADTGRAIGTDYSGAHRLYRSWDLVTWDLVDDDFVGNLVAGSPSAAVRVKGDVVEQSADGSTWVPIPNPYGSRLDKRSVKRFGDLGVVFTVGATDDEDVTFVAPDPASVASIATPPEGAFFVATPSGVITITNPARPSCESQLQRDLSDTDVVLDTNQARRHYQRCLADPVTSMLGPAGWEPIDSTPIAEPTVATPQLVRLGDQLIAVITDADFGLQLWTSPVDRIAWVRSTDTLPGESSGLPRPPWVASSADRVVVIPNGYEYESRIPVIVGTLA